MNETMASDPRFKCRSFAGVRIRPRGLVGDNFQPLSILVSAYAPQPTSGSEGNVRLFHIDSKTGIRAT